MRDQASAIKTGGLMQGGMLVAGGGLESLGAGKNNKDAINWGGKAAAGGDSAGKVFGEASAKKADADATEARNLAEQKQWNIDDAKERRQRAEKQQDTASSQLNQEMQAKRETNSFLLQRM